MNKFILSIFLSITLSVSLFSQAKIHSFKLEKSEFLLDGKPFQIISGEMHPARIPVEYWRQRIQMAKAMGCNTIAAYVFWNYHESEPGVFDFQTGNHNIAQFIKIVQEEGLFLILRPGPYVCAEWDFGGLPSYLLSIPDIKVRCMDPRYTEAADRYIKTLALQVKDLQVTKGGPILMVQAENEYGSYGNDRTYMKWVQDVWKKNGIEVPFYTADGATPYMLEAGSLPDAAIGLDPGANAENFAEATKVNPNVPSFCSELYPGWLTHWGEKWQRPDTTDLLKDVKWLMDNKKSFNFYVIHGGTNFGYWAGANAFSPTQYQPDVTSYDYDAPINEMGQATPKYFALRNLLAKYLPPKQKLPAIPAAIPVIEIPEIKMTATASVWDNLPVAIQSPQPKPMEMFGQKGGFILYRTKLIGHKKGKLRITELHDYATIFVDGKYIGKLDRAQAENIIEIPESASANPQLDILVEGMGRINFAEYMIDRKGITDRVSLNGMTLMDWQIFTLPFDEKDVQNLKFASGENTKPGLFFKGEFELAVVGDTYLDVSQWEKGVVWVNGHNLGRYWNIGPQKQLYCPAPWLKKGKNEIVIFDMHLLAPKPVKGAKSME
ncbi:beta-galactosidase [Aquipluma nitroreducens]|uniref:Beta-galactosidase n=1 Tax=Aquipluma nitroreducens TaxID=2010828 RepID=A0A5K7SAA4_9BACT|nr:beta-galactosidase family protein [Aquipluma nitroreducens]BBE18435.1 beta-galactosidase [Aquipluma nitroreducens]